MSRLGAAGSLLEATLGDMWRMDCPGARCEAWGAMRRLLRLLGQGMVKAPVRKELKMERHG